MRAYVHECIYFNTNDGYYYINNHNTQYITEEEALEAYYNL